MSTEGRVRLSCASSDVQTAHVHPMVGTPIEVPLPNTVSVAFKFVLLFRVHSTGGYGSRRLRLSKDVCNFKKCHAQFEKNVLQHVGFAVSEIAFGLLAEKGDSVDGLARTDYVRTRRRVLLANHSQLRHGLHV